MDGDESRLTESETIALIREMAAEPHPGLEIPIGDDAALVRFARDEALVTVDSVFEGVHFALGTYHQSDIGYKATAAAVSDIAAMGGQPVYALLSLGFPAAPLRREVSSLLEGVLEVLGNFHCALAGGDVCRTAAGLALTVTVLGTPPPGGAITRGGAAAGDVIGVTGTLGDAAAGLYMLSGSGGGLRARFPRLVEAHLRPSPRVHAGEILASVGVSAMTDVSDGLSTDLGHLCDESGTGCELSEASVPVSADLRELADAESLDALSLAMSGGEDYELLFTAAADVYSEAASSLAEAGVPCASLGTMRPPDEGRIVLSADGTRKTLEGVGYDHFR